MTYWNHWNHLTYWNQWESLDLLETLESLDLLEIQKSINYSLTDLLTTSNQEMLAHLKSGCEEGRKNWYCKQPCDHVFADSFQSFRMEWEHYK